MAEVHPAVSADDEDARQPNDELDELGVEQTYSASQEAITVIEENSPTAAAAAATAAALMAPTTPSYPSFPKHHPYTTITNCNSFNNNNPTSNSPSSPKPTTIPPEHRIHFLNALAMVNVPQKLLRSVPVVRVWANGTTEASLLQISEDKFTINLTSESSNDNGSNSGSSNGLGPLSETNSSSKSSSSSGGFFSRPSAQSKQTKVVRAVDIGELDRVQRGQSTQQFETAKKRTADQNTGGFRPVGMLSKSNSTRSINSNKSGNSSASFLSGTTAPNKTLDPERSFSIIFRGAETLDLMASTLEAREKICNALDRILEAYQRAKVRVAHDVRLLRYVWLDVDRKKTGFLVAHQVAQVFQQINFSMKQREVNQNYEKFGKVIGLDGKKRRRGLTFEQLADFLHYVRRNSWIVKPVTVLWNDLFGEIMNNGKKRETVSEKTFLERFLQTEQGQVQATLNDVRKLFRRLHDLEISHLLTKKIDLNRIHLEHFEAFLLSGENDAFHPDKEKFEIHDMNQPISEYWINSSHNTYLTGDQYTSNSRVEMYSKALYRGCRCLELDIWDGGKTSGGRPVPVVWHGHTMTSKIYFRDIIQTIKVFLNFHPDTFPIILSFENHCSIPYQEVMAQQLEEILGNALYMPTEQSYTTLPSPAALRGMVLIKGKRPHEAGASVLYPEGDDSDDDSDDDGPTSSMGDISIFPVQEAPRISAEKGRKHRIRIAPELARLTFFHGHKWKNWPDSVAAPVHHMHSFSENKVRSKCRQKHSHDWIIYNQRHMSRTYPAGSRLDSSNFNPLLSWSTGCQMAALNFQTEDAFLRLNDGRFRENGNCGYVLKPSSLLIKNDFAMTGNFMKLTIRVLLGSCLPKPKGQRIGDCIDPYVKLSVFDVKNEERETCTEYSTSAVKQNGFFPIWGQETFTFLIENWAVAMLQLTVFDKKQDDFIASSSIPISCLRTGIRSVKLHDHNNTRSGAFDFASLLLEIKKGEGVAEI